jgi:peptidyl-dipeptidase Dcp
MPDPLLAPWTGPYGGVPPFDLATPARLEPALEVAMAAQLAAIDRIAADAAPPTFENTLAAFERSGRALERVLAVYLVHAWGLSTPAFQEVERRMAPRLAAHQDRIVQNGQLFARIAAVHADAERRCPSAEARRLAWFQHTQLVLAGARLGPATQARVAAINERLATLFTAFNQNLLADEEDHVLLERETELAGLPASVRASAAAAAEARGARGRWAILNTRSSVEPFLAFSSRRDLRERVWRAFVRRGDRGGARDNQALVAEILALRGERARLRGYPTHAHWRLADSMARTPERALALMDALWPAAVARVGEEVRDMQAIADREGASLRIEPWDYRYYAEKVRRARYGLDEDELKPYLQLERLREAMFWVAGELLDLHFAPVHDVPVYHPDVRVWSVTDGAGERAGLWYFDPYEREGKRSGAWMSAYRNQERLDGELTPIVSNSANFVKGRPGEPILISWTDAQTLFHEFGHALHGLASSVAYPSLSGTSVPRDYVELPSQLLERWLATPEVLTRFALHVDTAQPMPGELVRRIERAEEFNQGFKTVEYLSAALVDLRLHLAVDHPLDPAAFEQETLAALGMPREVAMRHRTPQLAHAFGSDGYSAAYYSYLWAETLAYDAYEAFAEGGGPYDRRVAARLREHVLSRGNSIDPADGYRAFRGRDPDVAALLRRRGFSAPAAAPGTTK